MIPNHCAIVDDEGQDIRGHVSGGYSINKLCINDSKKYVLLCDSLEKIAENNIASDIYLGI